MPAGSTVDAVTIEFNHCVQCTTATYVFDTSFNGNTSGSYSSPNWCSSANRTDVHSLTLSGAALAAYAVGSTNEFRITNPNSCQGSCPTASLSGAHARVTVDYTAGSGGGGGTCDLTPVLNRLNDLEDQLDDLDALIRAEHASTRSTVTSQQGLTRAHVSTEANSTRTHVTLEHGLTRALISDKILRYLVEDDLSSANTRKMTAGSCLPEANGGWLGLTRDITEETILNHQAAGCNVSTALANFVRGEAELAAGKFLSACDWYGKACRAANGSCP